MASDEDIYYTTAEVAHMFRVQTSTVATWIKKGFFDKLESDRPIVVRTLGPTQGHYRILKAPVNKFLNDQMPQTDTNVL